MRPASQWSKQVEWAPPIRVEDYVNEFTENPKSAAKKLTAQIETALRSVTINAKSWDALTAAQMARGLLWPDDMRLPAEQFRSVSQRYWLHCLLAVR